MLESSAALTNNLGSATTPGSGVNSLVVVNGNLTANFNHIFINALAPLANGVYTLITYSGTLTGSFGSAVPTVPGPYTMVLTIDDHLAEKDTGDRQRRADFGAALE